MPAPRAKVLTEDILTWYSTDVDPGPEGQLLVETVNGYVLAFAWDPWPEGAFRWAKLPRERLPAD
jgi:hypothetical protein